MFPAMNFSPGSIVKDVLGNVFDHLDEMKDRWSVDYRPHDKPKEKPEEKPAEKPEGHKPPEHKPPEEKPEHKPPEEKPDEPDKVVHDKCGDDCYTADDCYDEKFVFDHESGGKDTIKCFNGEQGDRVDICGDYCVEKNDCGDIVIHWDHGCVTLEGVQHVEDCWII